MERNRVLWVIFSISLFLVVVLAGGLYLLRPVTDKETASPGETWDEERDKAVNLGTALT